MFELTNTYTIQDSVQAFGSKPMNGSHSLCVTSQNLSKVYTGKQMYGTPLCFAEAKLILKHR